jgi:hypothetical protein
MILKSVSQEADEIRCISFWWFKAGFVPCWRNGSYFACFHIMSLDMWQTPITPPDIWQTSHYLNIYVTDSSLLCYICDRLIITLLYMWQTPHYFTAGMTDSSFVGICLEGHYQEHVDSCLFSYNFQCCLITEELSLSGRELMWIFCSLWRKFLLEIMNSSFQNF